jgi:hypothetical protein
MLLSARFVFIFLCLKYLRRSVNEESVCLLIFFNSIFLLYFSFYHLTIHIITRLGIGTAI